MSENQCDHNLVLVIEDDIGIADCISQVLRFYDYKVIVFGDGKEALNFLHTHHNPTPGIILLDLMLPVMDGWEFLKILRKESDINLKQIPVIVISAAVERDSQINFLADEVLRKPVKLDVLLQAVKKHCCLKNRMTSTKVMEI